MLEAGVYQRCFVCRELKSVADFYAKCGLKCKPCSLARNKQWRDSRPEYESERDWHTRNPKQKLLTGARQSARKTGRTCSITTHDIEIPERCPYLGMPLTNEKGSGFVPSNISIDRIDSARGYEPGNVRVVSRLANIMKNSASEEQLLEFARNVLRLHGG